MKKMVILTASALALFVAASCSADSGSGSYTPKKGAASCTYTAGGSAAKKVDLPPAKDVADKGTTSAVLKLSQGDVNLTLKHEGTACTTHSFLSLAGQKYFDGTKCHRLTTEGIYVLQCGDPSGTGSGTPGYRFADELNGQETYPAGTIAMANAGPGTNGSQFFLVYKDTQLPPNYTVFGTFDAAGQKVVQQIADKGNNGANGNGDGKPTEEVQIKSVTVKS